MTITPDVPGVELSQIDGPTSILANTLSSATTVVAKMSEPTAASDVATSSGQIYNSKLRFSSPTLKTTWLTLLGVTSKSTVVIISTVTVVPILASPSSIASTTTLLSTLKKTQFRTVTNTLGVSMVMDPPMSLESPLVNSTLSSESALYTITVTKEPTTTTLYLSLVKPVQTKSHYPGWASGDSDMGSTPTRVNKYPETTAPTSDSVVARLSAGPSFDLFQSSHSKISLSVMLAKSGFMENPGTKSTATLTSASAITSSYAVPESTPDFGSSAVATGTLIRSPAVSSVSISSYVTDTLRNATTFSTLTAPVLSSGIRYSSIPRFLNTTLTTMTSSIVSTSSLAIASPSLGPTPCGELGDFILNVRPYPFYSSRDANLSQFDDIPPLVIGNDSMGPVGPAPVFNPYHQFDFSDGFTVVPPPIDAYLPSSGPLLLEFIPSFVRGLKGSGPNTAEVGFAGQISDGDHAITGCFVFNMYGASFGCNSTGPPCDFTFTGLHYDIKTDVVTPVTSQTVSISSCPALSQCHLAPIVLDDTFVGLNAVQIKAAAAGAPLGWWMDDLKLGWFDNSCSAGLCRQAAHIRK